MGMSIGTMIRIVHVDTDYPPPRDGTTTTNDEYPLVTHDPTNMFRKVTGELSWKIKSIFFRRGFARNSSYTEVVYNS